MKKTVTLKIELEIIEAEEVTAKEARQEFKEAARYLAEILERYEYTNVNNVRILELLKEGK